MKARLVATGVAVLIIALLVVFFVAVVISGRNADRKFDRQRTGCLNSGHQWVGTEHHSKGYYTTYSCQ